MKRVRHTSTTVEAAGRKSLGWCRTLGGAGDVNTRANKRAELAARVEAAVAAIPPSKPYATPRQKRCGS